MGNVKKKKYIAVGVFKKLVFFGGQKKSLWDANGRMKIVVDYHFLMVRLLSAYVIFMILVCGAYVSVWM